MSLRGGKRNLVLIGFMGAGKSVVGRELQRMTGFRLVDVDTEVERIEGITISEIFATSGEAAFREVEAREIRRISEGRNQIISTGGGAVLRADNMEALEEGGIVICLTASAETVYARTMHNTDRPLLQVEDPQGRIQEMLRQRRPYYDKASYVIDTEGKSPYTIASEILEAVGWKN